MATAADMDYGRDDVKSVIARSPRRGNPAWCHSEPTLIILSVVKNLCLCHSRVGGNPEKPEKNRPHKGWFFSYS
jgi:hypothetical protein